MNSSLKSMIKNIEERIGEKDPAAFEDAVRLAEQHPDEPKIWLMIAYANGMKNDYSAAIAAMTRAIALAPPRTGWYFTRGRYALGAADYESAIADFTKGLVLCDELKMEHDREVLHFLRAEAFVQLGRKAEARADLAHVEEDCVLWTIQVRSKAELLVLCRE